jgi:hypothetical protein
VIENELRTLLAERAGTVAADHPTRVTEVRSRVHGIRQRRTAGVALALVLLAAAGLTLARLPGKPATLPAGVPAGPYFDDAGTPHSVAGYRGASYFPFSGPTTWSLPVRPFVERVVVVARCAERGDLILADLTGPGSTPTLSCRVPIGDHYEGALLLDPRRVAGAGAQESTVATVRLRPGSGGGWAVGLLEPLFPDRISADNVPGSQLDGFTSPGGGRIPVTVPSDFRFPRGLFVTVVCVRDVRLQLTLDGRAAGVVVCDDASVEVYGLVTFAIREPVVTGLRGGQRVSLDVRPVGRRTDQWAVISVT